MSERSRILGELGFDTTIAQHAEPFQEQGFSIGRVVEEQRRRYVVRNEHGDLSSEVAGKLLFTASGREDFPAVGDWVVLTLFDSDTKAVIHDILPRRTILQRKAPGNRTETQIIAANIDFVFIIQGLDYNFNIRRLERYLVAVQESGAHPIVLLSKSDLLSPHDVRIMINEAQTAAPSIPVIAYSAVTGTGVEEIQRFITAKKTACFVGSSGVGKSTLINKLLGEEVLPTQEVRATDSRGRHTTTYRQLLPLANGGMIIDTPGMREFALWPGTTGIDSAFPDITELAEQCRFNDCSHTHEPDCAIQQALNDGSLDPDRYENYKKLKREQAFVAAKTDVRSAQERKQREKQLHRDIRRILKSKGKK